MSSQRGYSLPLSPGGTASLVPAPPWHYVGDFLVIEYWADPAAVAACLPEGLEPHADPGRCAALFVDWQSCSDSGQELLAPARGQYKEFFIVVNAMLDGEEVTTCPYIWVDRDFALARGWIQGFPKKLGQIDMTRAFGLDCRAEGRTFAGTLSANGHFLAQGSVTPERVAESGPIAANRFVSQASRYASRPPLEMPVAYTRSASIGSCRDRVATTALTKATSSTPVVPGVPQHPPPTAQARFTPSGYATTKWFASALASQP